MYIKEIIIEGFKVFKQKIHLKNLTAKSYFIIGKNIDEAGVSDSNGAGKTCILHAVVWCLLGQTPGGTAKDYLINNQSNSVSVTLKQDNNNWITRTKQKNKAEKLTFMIDRNLYELDLVEANKTLCELLGITKELFLNAFYLSRENEAMKFLSLSPDKRTQVIETLFDGDTFKGALIKTKEEFKSFENKQKALLMDIQNKKEQLAFFNNELTDKAKELKRLLDNKDIDIRQQIQDLEVSIQKCQNTILEKAELSWYNEEIQKLENTKDSALAKLLRLNRALPPQLKKDMLKCQTCFQDIPVEHRNKVNSQRFYIQEQIKKVDAVYEATLTVLNEYNLKHKNKRDSITKAEYTLKESKKQLALLQRHEEEVQTTIDNMQSKIDELQYSVNDLKNVIEFQKNELELVNVRLQMLEFWLQGFSPRGIRAMLLSQIKEYLSYTSTTWIHKLLGEDYKIAFPLGEQEFKLLVYRGEDIIAHKTLSAGQQWRLNFAMCLSINSMLKTLKSSKLNLLLLDDLFGDLDDTGIQIFIDVVRKTLNDTCGLVLTTTPRNIQEADILVIKQGGEADIKILGV